LKITFLGTGTSQGVPVIGCACSVCRSLDFRDKRFRTSIHVEVDNLSLVVDTGPDFRQQMLRASIKRLDAVLFTHAHRDHTAGLDDVRAFNFMQHMDMPVYGTAPTLEQLKIEYAYAFHKDAYPGTPRLNLQHIGTDAFRINQLEILPLPVMHLNMPVMGFRFKDFSYITDAKYISTETLERLQNTHVLVLNALQRERHISHFNLQEALEMIDVVRPKKTYLTHISHKLGLHREVTAELPENVHLAYDGLQVEL
jgi:phosphoribosyl 1,2-cyclic phosphate phosphodiesterase